ncbi:MAG: NAD(P)-dependent oxidoreductase [Candidatus Obscuribacterales bacterium]|nr:NAD(P)-dependent oxidoreductase [Steroidobacteraceae bacterium]
MNIFIAGGTGAIGRLLVPMLVAEGHKIVAMTRSTDRIQQLKAMGAEPVVGDVFDQARLTELVAQAKPEIVIHQLTAFGAKDSDPLAETIRVRIEGTRNLVAAALAANTRRFIAQSISFICTPKGHGLTDEDTPLYLDAPESIRPLAHAVSELERQSLGAKDMEGIVLLYGWFYGPVTNYDPNGSIPNAIRKGRMAIVGGGNGTYSFIGLRDAALATMRALSRGSGIYNIVDDHPAPLSEWLPVTAKLLNAPTPSHIDEATARAKLGDVFVYTMNEQRGASNDKAKRELDWKPLVRSWRDGFAALYS